MECLTLTAEQTAAWETECSHFRKELRKELLARCRAANSQVEIYACERYVLDVVDGREGIGE